MRSVQTPTRGDTTLSASDLNSLAATVQGNVLTPGSPTYDTARTLWNAMIDRRPAAIVQCATVDDVARAVRFGAERQLLIAVRGGGHNIAGLASCDNGLVIDLSPMRAVHVDQGARTVRVGAGATLGDVDRETQRFGLATPLGINSTTGVAGLTLGGGFGWLSRRLGLTIDNLVSADVVLANGSRVTASESEHPDLFWAIRGGGGNFGIVTSFEFRVHAVGPQVLAGLIVHPLVAARDVLGFYREYAKQMPDELACWLVMRLAPPLPAVPVEFHGKEILALAVCYSGEFAEGERLAKPLREFGRPVADMVGPQEFAMWQMLLDPMLTPGMRNYWKSNEFTELPDGLIDVLVDHAMRLPDPQCEIAMAQLGGAVGRVPADRTAYGHRDAQFVMNVHGRWADAAKDKACIAWARDLFRASAPYATGSVYVNFLAEDERERVKAAYGSNYPRLAALKNRYDADNLFRMNHNIEPAV
jgi:FAD/FMN-containing dehydrogenase